MLTRFHFQPLIDMIGRNISLTTLNVETNYLTGDFMARLFAETLKTQTLTEVRASNQVPDSPWNLGVPGRKSSPFRAQRSVTSQKWPL